MTAKMSVWHCAFYINDWDHFSKIKWFIDVKTNVHIDVRSITLNFAYTQQIYLIVAVIILIIKCAMFIVI